MKLFVAVLAFAAVAFAEPEADPALLYSNLGYNYGHLGYAGLGYAGAAIASPIGYAGLAAPIAAPLAATYTTSIAAAPIATVASTYSTALPYAGAYAAAGAYPYAYSGFYGAYNGLGWNNALGLGARLIKREAEAEPEADPALLYSNLGYAYGAAPLAYAGAPIAAAAYSTALPYANAWAGAYGAYPYASAYGAYPYAAYHGYYGNAWGLGARRFF
jgi:hypothetical protein